jgi:Ser/Thr protein kinase RdoA (MazF antagonist)
MPETNHFYAAIRSLRQDFLTNPDEAEMAIMSEHFNYLKDLLYGYPMQDISVSLFYVAWREDGKELIAGFREGYEQISPWPENRSGQLELLMLGRNLMLVNFLMNAPSEEERNLTPEYLDRLDERIASYEHSPEY